MIYPLKKWLSLKRGYRFGDKTFYNEFHVGLDILVPIGTPIYAPCDGLCKSSNGPEGGNTITFIAGTQRIRFLHLSEFKKIGSIKEGDLIGLSGNTGTLTTAPHCHIDVFDQKYIDPELFFKQQPMIYFKVSYINNAIVSEFQYVDQKLREFSDNRLGLQDDLGKQQDLYVPNAQVISDQACFEAIKGLQGQCIVVFYRGTMQRPWISTQYLKDGPNAPIIKFQKFNGTIDAHTLLFEIGHALILWYNAHRGSNPSLSNIDNYSGGESIVRDKVHALMPYLSVFDTTETSMNFIRADKDIYILKDGKKSLIYNAKAFSLIGDWSNVKQISQAELDAVPSTGIALAGIEEE